MICSQGLLGFLLYGGHKLSNTVRTYSPRLSCSKSNRPTGSQDLRFDDRACKELLLREEECRSKLWYDVEERKSSAGRVLRDIKDDGEKLLP